MRLIFHSADNAHRHDMVNRLRQLLHDIDKEKRPGDSVRIEVDADDMAAFQAAAGGHVDYRIAGHSDTADGLAIEAKPGAES